MIPIPAPIPGTPRKAWQDLKGWTWEFEVQVGRGHRSGAHSGTYTMRAATVLALLHAGSALGLVHTAALRTSGLRAVGPQLQPLPRAAPQAAAALRSRPAAVMQAAAAAGDEPVATGGFQKFSTVFSNLFPLWTLTVALLGLYTPAVFSGISTSYFTGLLGLLMLSMGITLTVDDFKRVLTRPGVMVLGFIGCYVLMPAMALGLAKALGLNAVSGPTFPPARRPWPLTHPPWQRSRLQPAEGVRGRVPPVRRGSRPAWCSSARSTAGRRPTCARTLPRATSLCRC